MAGREPSVEEYKLIRYFPISCILFPLSVFVFVFQLHIPELFPLGNVGTHCQKKFQQQQQCHC